MNPVLQYRLWKMNRAARPSGEFSNRLKMRFGLPVKHNWLTTSAFRVSFGTLAIVCSMGAGTVSYAYASDDVTPDHPLYAVRQAVETVEEAAAPSPEERTAVQQKHLKRRVHEIEVMKTRLPNAQEDEEAGQVLDRVEDALKQGIEQKESPHEVGEHVKEALKKTDRSKLRPFQRRHLENVQSNIERALNLQKED